MDWCSSVVNLAANLTSSAVSGQFWCVYGQSRDVFVCWIQQDRAAICSSGPAVAGLDLITARFDGNAVRVLVQTPAVHNDFLLELQRCPAKNFAEKDSKITAAEWSAASQLFQLSVTAPARVIHWPTHSSITTI